MKRIVTGLTLAALLAVTARGLTAEPPLVLDVWPGQAPGETGPIGEEKAVERKPFGCPVKGVTNISRPALTVCRPAKDKDSGAAVLVCPGGGYNVIPGSSKARDQRPG